MKKSLKVLILWIPLLIFFNTCNIQARRWSPGEAETRARRGDFNVSDKDQLLADIPSEWKKENRKLVRDIQEGYWGRTARNKVEGIQEPVVEKKQLSDIVDSFNKNMDRLYLIKEGRGDNNGILSYAPKHTVNKITMINLQEFDEKFKVLIQNHNDFFNGLFDLEIKDNGVVRDVVSMTGQAYLQELIKLKSTFPEMTDHLKIIAGSFNDWMYGRLIVLKKYQDAFTDFISTLEESNKAFNIPRRNRGPLPVKEELFKKQNDEDIFLSNII